MEVLSFPKGIEPEPADEGQVEKERSALDGDLGLAGEMGFGPADEDELRQAQPYAHGRQYPPSRSSIRFTAVRRLSNSSRVYTGLPRCRSRN